MSDVQNSEHCLQGQTIVINQVERNNSNGLVTAGFVLGLISIFLSWVPFLGWILWFIGLIMAFAGIFKQPRGLGITSLVLSFIGLIFILTVFVSILALGSRLF